MIGSSSPEAAPGRPRSAGRARRSLAHFGGLLLLELAAGVLIVATAWGPTALSTYCFVVSGKSVETNQLSWVDKSNFDGKTNELTLGAIQTSKTDSIALHPATGVLFAADTNMAAPRAHIGTLNQSTGLFAPLPNPIGTGRGPLGEVPLYDISGLSFEPATGRLYASHIRWAAGFQLPDVLFQVDVQTGQVVRDAFGPGQDYVVVNPLVDYPALTDLDDIAIEPVTGQMYAIINDSGNNDRLVRIDKQTGAIRDVGAFGIPEVEGLDFDPNGSLWATAGGDAIIPNALYEVDTQTGVASHPRFIDNNFNYEALACMVSQPPPP